MVENLHDIATVTIMGYALLLERPYTRQIYVRLIYIDQVMLHNIAMVM